MTQVIDKIESEIAGLRKRIARLDEMAGDYRRLQEYAKQDPEAWWQIWRPHKAARLAAWLSPHFAAMKAMLGRLPRVPWREDEENEDDRDA